MLFGDSLWSWGVFRDPIGTRAPDGGRGGAAEESRRDKDPFVNEEVIEVPYLRDPDGLWIEWIHTEGV